MIAQARQGISWDELKLKAMTFEELMERLDFELPANFNFSVSRASVYSRGEGGRDRSASHVEACVWSGIDFNERFAGDTPCDVYKDIAEGVIIPSLGSRPVAVMR